MSTNVPILPRSHLKDAIWRGQAGPIAIVVLFIIGLWYIAAVFLNTELQRDAFANAGTQQFSTYELVAGTLSQERPKLPAPHQIVQEIDRSVFEVSPTSKRSLVYHAGITLQATLAGFAIGSLLGVLLAVLIVHVDSLDRSLMPWIIASQTIPIIALAPMVVIILNQLDVTGIVPKATISAYLSFFPVTVGVVKGLRSPDPLQLDLMRTYSASKLQTFIKLRLPAAVPFLFASLKVAVAASLVGAVVAELTKSEDGGLGARLLAGSYYGQTIQIWAAIFTAAICACVLIGLVGIIDQIVSKRMGQVP
jgi:NitT/TauT family transport system permease protein